MRWCWLERTYVLPERHMRAAVQLLLPVQVDCDDRRGLYLTRVRYEGFSLGDHSPLPSICHLLFFGPDRVQTALPSPKYHSSFSQFCNNRINSHSYLLFYHVIEGSDHGRSFILGQVDSAITQAVFQAQVLRPSSSPSPINGTWNLRPHQDKIQPEHTTPTHQDLTSRQCPLHSSSSGRTKIVHGHRP